MKRVVPMCEMDDCEARADYFWHWQVRPVVSWIPICAIHADELAPLMARRPEDFPVAPIAEMAGPEYRGSEVIV